MQWSIEPPIEQIQVMLEAAFVYRDAGCYDHARDIFLGVRSLLPASEIAEIGLGTVAFQQGRFEEARKHYLRALDRQPQSAWAQAQLGEAELFLKNPDKAADHLRQAIALDPGGEFGKMAEDLLSLADQVHFS